MIDPQKMMPGNWVQSKKRGMFQVDLNYLLSYSQRPDKFEGEYEPFYVPLSPEVLEASGFIKHDSSNEYWTFYALPNNWYIAQSHHNEPSAGVKEGCFYWGDEYREVTSLHDLQNLYFALCRKEIIYSPVK